MKAIYLNILLLIGLVACGGGGGSNISNESMSQDQTRVFNTSANAFSSHVANLTDLELIRQFNIGDDFFENPWVQNTASTSLRDGLGPLFNNNACQDCHVRDGRGHAPSNNSNATQDFSSILFKAVKSDITPEQLNAMLNGQLGSVEDSAVGPQIQQDSNFGVQKEASLGVTYAYTTVSFSDGFTVELRKPQWSLQSNYADQGYDFDKDTIFSARVAQPMIGLGLLGLVSEKDILQLEDVNDTNGDGISGKVNWVWDVGKNAIALGRYGWKAGQPSVKQQAAGAFSNDMGLTSELFPNEGCLPHQLGCVTSPNGNGDSQNDYPYEVARFVLDAIAFYSNHLAVPKRRNPDDSDVLAGRALFMEAGCGGCHVENQTTIESKEFPHLSNQTIQPYTDLLLHDMGGALADFKQSGETGNESVLVEFQATTREWRTPPLWGIGLTFSVDPEATFLHDGRARSIMEAILWHAGEAEPAKQTVLTFNAEKREQLLSFLNDL